MIPNIAQSIDDIVKTATPEQKIVWQQVRLITGENAAIQQLYYAGAITASEFATYSANKLYLALNLKLPGYNTGGALATVVVHNQANTAVFSFANFNIYWDVTAATPKYQANFLETNNLIFGRLANTSYNQMIFTGFKIIY